MKRISTYVVLSFLFSNTLLAAEINVLGVQILDNISKYAQIKDGQKCKKKNCSYIFKKKSLNLTPDYFTNYYLRTDKNYKVISISAYRLKNDTVFDREKFINSCKQDKSFMIDYFSEKFDLEGYKFIDTYEQSKSILDGSPALWNHSKIYLKSQKKVLNVYCNYSKDKKSRWIISVLGVTLMTQGYHKSIQEIFKTRKIDEFDSNQIKSFFYPSSY